MIAALGIVVSAAALFVILSVFSGLKDFSLSFTNATDPDLKLTPSTGKSFIITPEQAKQITATEGIAGYTQVVEERVLFYFDEKEHVAYLKGIDSLFTTITPMKKQMLGGMWLEPETSQVVVGAGTFKRLSLGLFDLNRQLIVYVPKAGKGTIDTPEDAFNKAGLNVVGVYSINDDVDSKYVFCDLPLAQALLEFKPNQLTALEFKLKPGADEAAIRQKLESTFNNKIVLKNRQQLNDSLYKMLNAENLVTYLFCSLVVVLTLFCLAGALIMLILDKKENIKTLYNLGAEIKALRKIFFYQGLFITSLGMLFGLVIGSAIIIIQQTQSLVMITATMAYPVNFNLANILIVVLTIFILGYLASKIAAGRVTKKLLENS